MLPFICTDLHILLKSLMSRFLKPDVLDVSLAALIKVDLNAAKNLLPLEKLKVGFVVDKQLCKPKASEEVKVDFRASCRAFLRELVKKMMEKAPVAYSLVRNMRCLDPREMASKERREENEKRITAILQLLTEAGRVPDRDVNQMVSQYRTFLDQVFDHDEFVNFIPGEENSRVDTLMLHHMGKKKGFDMLWQVVRKLLLLSHGQASVERGFSVNKETTTDNISTMGLVARRQIYNHVQQAGGVIKVQISKELMISASSARSRYSQYLDLQKEEKAKAERGEKRKAMEAEVGELKAKKRRFEGEVQQLVTKADKLALDCEATGALRLVTESNALRQKAKSKQEDIANLEKMINLEMEKLKESL